MTRIRTGKGARRRRWRRRRLSRARPQSLIWSLHAVFVGTARKGMGSVDVALVAPGVSYVGHVQGHISRKGQRAFYLLAQFAKRN
jgi:hypothetical protein